MAGKKVSSIYDEIVVVLDGYEALEEMASLEDVPSLSLVVLLDNLNRQLRCVVDRIDDGGMVR